MMKFIRNVKRLGGDRRGISALEYGILAVIVVGAVAALSGTFNNTFNGVFSKVDAAVTAR